MKRKIRFKYYTEGNEKIVEDVEPPKKKGFKRKISNERKELLEYIKKAVKREFNKIETPRTIP